MRFKIFDLGLVEFKKSWQFQKEIFSKVRDNKLESGLILCQHFPVITLGRSAHKKNILITDLQLRQKGICVYAVERGGDVTYHGPGQLLIYPICNLNYFKRDIHLFLRKLEGIALKILSDFGVLAKTKTGLTGVWVGNKKIASIGIAIKNWISYHGLAINIKDEDLLNFSLIRPCGMDIKMTSLESILKREIFIDGIKIALKRRWQNGQGGLA